MAKSNKNQLRAAIRATVERNAEFMLQDSGQELLDTAQATAEQRVGRISGTYHSNFRLERSKNQVRVVNNTEYADIIERGSAPHIILPRRARALRIEPPITSYVDGSIITHLSKVNHPGTRAQWVLRDSLRQTVRNKFGGRS